MQYSPLNKTNSKISLQVHYVNCLINFAIGYFWILLLFYQFWKIHRTFFCSWETNVSDTASQNCLLTSNNFLKKSISLICWNMVKNTFVKINKTSSQILFKLKLLASNAHVINSILISTTETFLKNSKRTLSISLILTSLYQKPSVVHIQGNWLRIF